ncbi:MAG: hypothetical protein ACUVRK_06010, partial [Spirochaetota bacterium]
INIWRETMNVFKTIPCILIIIISTSVHASDLGIGVVGWYADWKMESDHTSKMDPVFYIGPSISYQFSQSWSTALVALYTASPYKATEDNESTDIKRYDTDLTLNYQLTRFIKFFVGGKYLGFFFSGGKHYTAGPGGGIGLTIPVIENFYFLANASISYQWGKHEESNESGKSGKPCTEYGYNTTAQVAHYAASVGLTTSVGYRYHLIRTKYDTSDSNKQSEDHTFKGFIVLLVKSFNF